MDGTRAFLALQLVHSSLVRLLQPAGALLKRRRLPLRLLPGLPTDAAHSQRQRPKQCMLL